MKTKNIVAVFVGPYREKKYFNTHTEAGFYMDTHPEMISGAPENVYVLEWESKLHPLEPFNGVCDDPEVLELKGGQIYNLIVKRRYSYDGHPSYISVPKDNAFYNTIYMDCDIHKTMYYVQPSCQIETMPDYAPIKSFVDNARDHARFFQAKNTTPEQPFDEAEKREHCHSHGCLNRL